MAKLYSKKKSANSKLPEKETVNFILNFSKSFSVLRVGKLNVEIISN